jgi:hypothetical protein
MAGVISASGFMKTYFTREEWLVALVEELRTLIEDSGIGLEVPAVKVSCSWPSKSIRKRIGECWHSTASEDGSRHIFVSPLLDEDTRVADVTLHELGHACLPDGTGHKAPFKKFMKAVGLEGKATATVAGEELTKRLNGICKALGEYPHKALSLQDAQGKKQTTRLVKLECPGCGYILRSTAKWIETGLPTCVCGEEFKEA